MYFIEVKTITPLKKKNVILIFKCNKAYIKLFSFIFLKSFDV